MGGSCQVKFAVVNFAEDPWNLCGTFHSQKCCSVLGVAGSVELSDRCHFCGSPWICVGNFSAYLKREGSHMKLSAPEISRNPPPPPCDIPSGCCSFTGPWTITHSSLRMLRWVAAFCCPLRPVLLLVSFPRSRSPVVGVPGLCWMWQPPPLHVTVGDEFST